MIIGNENLKDLFPNFEEDVKENGIDLTCILKRLCECDTGEGADFSETLTDLKWVRMTLDNRLKSIEERGG